MGCRIKDDDDVRALHELYWGDGTPESGMSFLALSLETGIQPDTIRAHFKRLGLPTRGVGQRVGVPHTNRANEGNTGKPGARVTKVASRRSYTGHRRRSY